MRNSSQGKDLISKGRNTQIIVPLLFWAFHEEKLFSVGN